MKKVRIITSCLLIVMAAHILAPVAAAHPLGNFTINHYAGVHVRPRVIVIDYVLDMAEIPTFQEIAALDANGNGQADADETAPYHLAQCQMLRTKLDLRLNGRQELLSVDSSSVEFPAGAGGLPTLRLNCVFRATMPVVTDRVQVEFNNKAYAERLGWREIMVTSDSVSLEGELASVSHSLSQRLTAYPDNRLANPLDQREISFSLGLMAKADQQPMPLTNPAANPLTLQPSNPPTSLRTGSPIPDRNDGFTRLITVEQLGIGGLLLVLVIAFGWGAAHALTPGHGKTIVAAYLVGSRGTTRHACFLGLTTTITHTAGVFVLGFLTLFASRFILPEQLYPWLGVASGLIVVVLGLSLFKIRLSQFVKPGEQKHHHHNHRHDHDHNHARDHDHPHNHDHAHHHDPNHNHDHAYGHAHSHLPPDADGSPVTWRSLLALGISGGLIPCPSALVVMLSAIALGRISFGLVLIVAFSLGLASVLTAIGLLWVHAGRLGGRLPLTGPLFRVVPALSALFIMMAGLAMTWQALVETGVLPLDMAMVTMILNSGR